MGWRDSCGDGRLSADRGRKFDQRVFGAFSGWGKKKKTLCDSNSGTLEAVSGSRESSGVSFVLLFVKATFKSYTKPAVPTVAT